MQTVLRALVAFACLALVVPSALGQRRQIKELDTRIGNIQTDLEILQEFIQEQATAIKDLKTKVAEQGKLKEELGKTNRNVSGLNESLQKNTLAIKALDGQIKRATERVTEIEETLKRKKVDFTGELRIRPEYRQNHRYFNSLIDQDANFGSSHRARIGVDVRPADWIHGRFTLQDARTWGSPTLFMQTEDYGKVADIYGDPLAPQDSNKDSALRIHEAYLDIGIPAAMLDLRIGRQIWDFGSGRMIGSNDWEQRGRSFDGLDLTFAYEKYFKADLLFSWIDERNASDGQDLTFGGLYATVPYFEGMDIDLYYLALADERDDAVRKVNTFGARLGGELPWHKPLVFDLEFSLQTGTVTEQGATDNATADNDHFAVSYHAELGYRIPVPTTPTPIFFFDLASGDGNTSPVDPGNDASVGWVPLFPTRHAVYGLMDMWHQTNIWDVGGKLQLEPVAGLHVGLELHSLHMYDERGAIPWGGNESASFLEPLDTTLGIEFDLYANYLIHENLGLGAGYSVFAPGKAFEDLDERDPIVLADEETGEPFRYPRGDAAHWLYLQASLTF